MLEFLDLPLGRLERIPDTDQDILMRMIVVGDMRDGNVLPTRSGEVNAHRCQAAGTLASTRAFNQNRATVQVRVDIFKLANFLVDPVLQMLGWLDVAIRDFRFYFHICTKAWLAGEQFDPCHAQKIFRRNGQDVSELHALHPLVALIELSKAFPFFPPRDPSSPEPASL